MANRPRQKTRTKKNNSFRKRDRRVLTLRKSLVCFVLSASLVPFLLYYYFIFRVDDQAFLIPLSLTSPRARGTATTTRYWDCSGGSCGCAYIPAGLNDKHSAHCPSNSMFAAPAGNAYGAKYYGTAAASAALGGGEWLAPACDTCWKIVGTSNVPGPKAGTTTTVVLRGANFCPDGNAPCENGKKHFDIAAPGFDYLATSLSNTCHEVVPEELAGMNSCSWWMINSTNPDENCDCAAFQDPVLRAGCENFLSLYWDDPVVEYEVLRSCPPELTTTPCGVPFPPVGEIPETCANAFSVGQLDGR